MMHRAIGQCIIDHAVEALAAYLNSTISSERAPAINAAS